MRVFWAILGLCSCQPEASDSSLPEDTNSPSSFLSMGPVSAGSFTMGCTSAQEPFCDEEEKPTREITLSRGFWMSRFEITQSQYSDLMGTNPVENEDCLECPVERVSWDDAARFALALSQEEGLAPCYTCIEGGCTPIDSLLECTGYRLPTEAEWEYATRCGQDFVYAGGDDAFELAWTRHNATESTHPVGQLLPNDCGFYDLSGNVWEWVHDKFGSYANLETLDPTGPTEAQARIVRGGAWNLEPSYARVSNRRDVLEESENNIGFRLVQSDILGELD